MSPRFRYALVVGVVVMAPLLIYAFQYWAGQSVSTSKTTVLWLDEIMYYHQALSFKETGFGSGYYTQYERPASAEFTPFYAWGPLIPAIYGTIGRITGWTVDSIPIVNAVLLTAAVGAAVISLRPTLSQLRLLLCVVATFAPLWVYVSTSMVELLQMTIAVLYAAALWPFLRADHVRPPTLAFAAPALLMTATFIRPSWALLMLPTLILVYGARVNRRGLAIGVLSLGLTAVGVVVMGKMSAPYLTDTEKAFRNFVGPVEKAIGAVLYSVRNINQMIQAPLTDKCLFLVIILVILWALVRFVRPSRQDDRKFWLFIFACNAIMVFALIAAYKVEDRHGFRILGVHLLTILILLALRREYGLILITSFLLCLSTAAALPKILTDFQTRHDAASGAQYEQFKNEFDVIVKYREGVDRWCNTITATVNYALPQSPLLLSVPAGIGLSIVIDPRELTAPPRARYLLISDAHLHFFASSAVRRLVRVPEGALYENLDSACPDL